jgi:Zn-dependent metalloprotease
MKRIKVCIFFFFVSVFIVSGQKFNSGTPVFFPEKETVPSAFFTSYQEVLEIPSGSTYILEKKGFSKFSKNHLTYNQYHDQIPVYGHALRLHLKNGKVDHVTGTVAKNLPLSAQVDIPKDEVLQGLMPFFQTDESGEFTEISDTEVTRFEKIYVDKNFPEKTNQFCLAFDVHLFSNSTGKHLQYFVDAQTGRIIFTQDLVCSFSPKGTAPSYHYGTVEIETEQVEANKYVLRDVTRGNGNTTFLNTAQGDILLSDDDNVWEKPVMAKLGHVAYDAHYCTMKFYDFLLHRFDYSGINGNGRSMIARVNINNGADLVNAFWNNQNASFGNGNCHYHPLTTLSIVGHEFAHGITSEHSKLIYSGESGALNEAFSDIIGKAFELIENPDDFQWPIGHEIVATRFAKPFRSMEDPNIYNNPKMYKGKHWRDGGGVHSNSGVLNHWFYLLVNGASGKNELDTAYHVNAMDVQDILDIVFLCQTDYLEPASTYPDMYAYSKLACETLFGKNSPQYTSIVEAWKAVGLPYIGIPIENYDDLVLTAKIKDDANNSITCYQGAFPVINIFLANKGTIFYPAGTLFNVNFIRNGVTVVKSVSLPSDLAPDSTRVIRVLDYEWVDKTEYFSIEMNLLHNDHVQSNNRFFLYFQNFNTTGVDLQISGISHQEVKCFSNEIAFVVRVRNNSCFTSVQGAKMQLDVKDLDLGQTLSFEHTSSLALAPRQETVITARLPYNWASLNFAYKINADFDVITTNNESQYTVNEKGIVNGLKKFTFNNEDFDLDFKHNSTHSRFLFENEHYFRTKTNFSSSNSPCLDEADNFKNINAGVAQFTVAETCLDVSSFNQPGLRFDMRQFRSDFYSAFPELEGNSTILKIEFLSDQGNYLPEPIKNQDVGAAVPYIFPIPKGFKGIFKIVAFTSRHDGTAAINGKSDVILLDNVEIFDIVSVNEEQFIPELTVVPNPADDYARIQAGGLEMQEVRLVDISGKVLKEYRLGTGTREMYLPTLSLSSGSYIIEVKTRFGVLTRKLIKFT